jgi:tRNA threonylcarbamoyladenosine biosynthesis protein TsaE
VVTLSGDLGAGKTACVQAFAKALGITETVISPTYVIMKNYSIPHSETCGWSTLVHIDAYRIEDEVEMEVLGFRDILNDQKAIVCIEWPERIPGLLPKPTVHIAIEQAGETRREVTLS